MTLWTTVLYFFTCFAFAPVIKVTATDFFLYKISAYRLFLVQQKLTVELRCVFRRQIDITDYVESNEWKLLEYPAEKHVLRYPCCDEPFIDLTYTIRVKRIAVFYSFILVLPCVLLSLLTLVSFWLPPESPAKVLLGTSAPTNACKYSRRLVCRCQISMSTQIYCRETCNALHTWTKRL